MEIKKMELNEEMEELMEEEFSKEEKKHNIFCNYEPYSFVASENGNVLGMITGYTSYEEVYNYLLHTTTVTRDGQSEELIAKTKRRLKQFAYELQMQYSGFAEIVKWILRVNSFVEDKLSERFIFSDIYKMDSDEMYKFVNEVIDYIGIPLIMNAREKYISIRPKGIQVSEFIQFFQKFGKWVLTYQSTNDIINLEQKY